MMMEEKLDPFVPDDYELTETTYRCVQCDLQFTCLTSHDNTLVKFTDSKSQEECWLPTFEKGGYLDLLEKCVPGFHRDNEITMKVFRLFEKRFDDFQHRPSSGGYWRVANGCECSQCYGKDLEIVSERLIRNPDLKWLEYAPIT